MTFREEDRMNITMPSYPTVSVNAILSGILFGEGGFSNLWTLDCYFTITVKYMEWTTAIPKIC